MSKTDSNQKDTLFAEEALEQYYSSVPSPRTEFLLDLEKSLINTPVITRRSSGHRPLYALTLVSFILILSFLVIGPAKVLAAIQSLSRYIPGFGLVSEEGSLRALAEPVSSTREGVTVWVKQAIVSPERTSITLTIEGLSPQSLPSWTVEEQGRICSPIPEIELPDGVRWQPIGFGRGYVNGIYQWNYFFPPLPTHVNTITWVLPCLPETLIGKAPGDWNIPLRFVAAPPNLVAFPVNEVASSGETAPMVAGAAAGTGTPTIESPANENPLQLEKVTETEDGYIFIGRFYQILPARITSITPEIVDANGDLQGYSIPGDILQSPDIDQAIEWAYQIHNKNIAWPVTIRFNTVSVNCEDPQAKFIFDAGKNPQNGQVWQIDRDFAVGPCNIHITSIKRIANGYLFRVDNKDLSEFIPGIEGATPKESMTYDYPTYQEVRVLYEQEPPEGVFTISLASNSTLIGPWQVQWQPAGQER